MLALVLQESQGLKTYAFLMLLLAMVSRHILTLKLMVAMVAEFCSLVILILNTVVHELQVLTEKLCLYSPLCNDTFQMQIKFIDFMGIELCFFKKKKKMELKTWTKCGNHFSDITYILHHNTKNFSILVIFHTSFTLIFKVKST